jgi:hypothetical protein
VRATDEERDRILGAAPPFDADSWMRGEVPPSPEELADLDAFLREREALRQLSLATSGARAEPTE